MRFAVDVSGVSIAWKMFMWPFERSLERVVHVWPIGGTYCRGSRQIGHSFFSLSIEVDEC